MRGVKLVGRLRATNPLPPLPPPPRLQKCSVCPEHAAMLSLEVLGKPCRFCQQVGGWP